MSTRLLYHACGIRGSEYTRTDYQGGHVIFTIHPDPKTCRCSACGSPQVRSRGRVERRFRAGPIGSHATFVDLPIPRVACQACGVVRQVKIPFADPRRSSTSTFERYALERGRRMTIRDVALHLDVSWDMIKDLQKRDLARRFATPKLKHLRHIASDEIAIAKGHRSLTLVLDLESGAVVFVGDGKGAKALKPFWNRLRGSKAQIEAVAMDMAPADREAVSTSLPQATIVFDRFPVVKLFNEKLAQLRRDLHRAATEKQHTEVLTGTRWLLRKNPENLDVDRDEKRRLEEALALNQSLAVASSLKEDLRQFWEQPGQRFATAFLNDWLRRAEASGIKRLQEMAKTLAAHRSGLLAYSDVPITSGPLEGTNNKSKTMKRQAKGFRDPEFFKLKILAIHESKYELVG
jgi:transposase